MNPKPFLYPNNDQVNPYTGQGDLPAVFARMGGKIKQDKFIAKSGGIYLLDSNGSLIQSVIIGSDCCALPKAYVELKDDPSFVSMQLSEDSSQWISVLSAPIRGSGGEIFYLVIQADEKITLEQIQGFMMGLQVSLDVECENTKTHEMLFQITKKIYSSMDVDEVLHAIVGNISVLYPKLKFELWLSHDSFSTTLPVKPFNFNVSQADFSLRAFMEGEVVVHNHDNSDSTLRKLTLAAPLRGKQGIYGVLELYSDQEVDINEKDIEYITILADIAGNAFENAQLYLQSQKLIRELLLINEIVQQLNKSLILKDILCFVLEKLTQTYKAEYCAILRRIPGKDRFFISAATVAEHQGVELNAKLGQLARIFNRKEAIIVSDCTEEEDTFYYDYKSLLGVPLLSGTEVEGAILLCDSRKDFFSFDDFKLLEILAQHMNLAITNASLHNEVERLAITDTLTGLYNRKYLNEHITVSLNMDARGSLILMDIDFFKRVNDTHGHKVGDQILKQVSEVLKTSIRKNDVAARWGGEELAVYLPNVKLELAIEVAERIRMKIMKSTKPQVTISSGVSFWSAESTIETVETLFHAADMALYEAKHHGRNQVRTAK
ncbi:MAG TPA: diguanylate cyclase [Bacillota bacterium]|nr:diguanylate cyclase [Bacillota bacterium]